jgi:hypothetical protein
MKIREIFRKPVDRPIEGVIKADDNTNLRREVEEYVITNEVSKKLSSFFDAYLSGEASNGVWISGFFGSGKSHLLKMLSLLLQNWTDSDFSVVDSFVEKYQDEFLVADLKKAAAIPSRSILFNIDQKADIVTKSQSDALLSVFIKVFDEFCGYYGKQGYIAKFERDLDSRGIYKSLKDAYKSITGKDWEVGREEPVFESENISKAYKQVSGNENGNITDILDKYRDDYRVSIEDFAKQVNGYIEKQPIGFRLNFFVDEVGQYIADNSKLMLNLQTIAESLATICKGRAWIIVTSQEDMDAVIGELDQQQGNDFSKIQARFATRLSLTSANVDEVIQKRLLHKNDLSLDQLTKLYHTHVNNFKTMFHFVDGAQTYRNFNDKEDFIFCYPFIPYQFTMFQKAIKSLSTNHSFEGRHRSVGERSMLGVFQQVVKSMLDEEVCRIATFDLMFDGIRSSIKSQIQQAIINAEKNLGNPFAVRVLKILFMLKYVKDYKATVRNVSILLMESFETDINELKDHIQEALNLLETQTYIQRNGDLYEFLTNEEKDVEQEIKNTPIDNVSLLDEIDKVLFTSGQIIKSLKIRYEDNKQDFSYTRRIDNKQYGKEHEITIHLVTPLYEFYDAENDKQLISHAIGKPELTIVLPADKRFWDDLGMYVKTEKCFQVNITSMQKESTRKILFEKQQQNKEREQLIKNRLAELIVEAKIYASGDKLDTEALDANTRIVQAFQVIVGKVYPNLKMLKGVTYTEQDIGKYLNNTQITAEYVMQLTEAEQEVFSHITSNSRLAKKTTVSDVLEKFSRKPYGWGFYAILCQVAKLYASGKVEIYADGGMLENSILEKALKNTAKHPNMIIQPQQDITPSQMRRLKDLYNNLFDAPAASNDAKALAKETSAALDELVDKLDKVYKQKDRYPFATDLENILDLLRNAIGKPYNWYYTDFVTKDDEIVLAKTDFIDPILSFMSGNQKVIYDSIREFFSLNKDNLSYLEATEVERLKTGFNDPKCYKNNHIQQLKPLLDILADKLGSLIKTEQDKALKAIKVLEDKTTKSDQYKAASQEIQGKINTAFSDVMDNISQITILAVIKDTLQRFNTIEYPKLMALLKLQKPDTPEGGTKTKPEVSFGSVLLEYASTGISNEQELDDFIKNLKKALATELTKGNKIVL